jgi:hypothetical protein
MVDATFLLNLVETVGILIGVTIGIIEIRNIRETRRYETANQFLQYASSIQTMDAWISFLNNRDFSSYEEWSEKYGPRTNPKAARYLYNQWFYFNALGKHVKRGYIELDEALTYISPIQIIPVWEKSKPIFEEWRKRYNHPTMFDDFEYLYNRTKERYQKVVYTPPPPLIQTPG